MRLVVAIALASWVAACPVHAQSSPPPLTYRTVRQSDWPMPLEVPPGFTVEEVARGLTSPRFMALDDDGSLVIAEHTEGKVVRLRDTRGNGTFDFQQEVARDLTYVHSVVFMDGQLFAAAEDRVVTLSDFTPDGRAGTVRAVVDNLPSGARDLYGHRTRTLLPGPDGKMYLSIGSACDVCEDNDPLRARVVRMNPDGSEPEVFATGLRNSVGIAFRPEAADPELWGVDMGRNNLGASLPPDELNLIQQGLDYGWPYCYGEGQPNPEFGDAERCATTEPPRMELPAHWSPLGIVFYEGSMFPADYVGDALIAFHGSAPDQTGDVEVGYRVVRVHFEDGQPVWMQDLLRGFQIGAGHWARPVGLVVATDGSVLVSDDWSGRIFRIRYTGATSPRPH
ncbi:MAG: sorbosone dehydrogenase family protein [Chloroflexota bacterium]